jgi:murein DD-endopeptidase MepM/ murein hydrolase activator NlpD
MKTYTIMLIPSSRAKYREFHLTQFTLFIICLLILASAGFFTFLIMNNVRISKSYEAAMVDKGLLKIYKQKAQRIDSLMETVNAMQEKVNNLTSVNNQLQTMVGVGSSDISVGGGSSIEDFEDAYLLNKSKLLSNLEVEIDDILDDATKQAEVSESIDGFFKEHTTMLSHLPTLKPVAGGWVSSYFGRRLDPFTKKNAYHSGLDISASRGSEIIAPADGIVTFASYQGTYGNMLRIDHGNGFKTYYGHLQDFNVRVGEKVSRGDVIAYLGRTGRTTGPHLHYEVRLNGKPVNPMKYMVE